MTSVHSKSPTVARIFALLVCLVVPLPAAAQQPTMSADQVVRLALDRGPIEDIAAARVEAIRAALEEETVHPVPTFGLSHEQVLGESELSYLEVSATIEQELDFSGWRSRLRAVQSPREAAVRATMEQQQLELATAVRNAFYEVRRLEERLLVLDAWIIHLEAGIRSVGARRDRGDASTYEVRRVERELEIARAQRIAEDSALAEAWATLDAWTQWEARPALLGSLAPESPSVVATSEPPELIRLDQLVQGLQAEAAVWGSPFARGWVVGAGYRFADASAGTGHGFIVSLSLPLMFWNIDEARIDRLSAEETAAQAELEYRRDLSARGQVAAQERLDSAWEALESLPDPARDAELTGLAEAAFSAGETTLTELLDAIESETELRLARIDLQWVARRAALNLDYRLGIGVPQ